MRHAIAMMLESDTIDHLDRLRAQLSKQRGQDVSRSEAVEKVVLWHWMDLKRQAAAKTAERRERMKIA